MLEVVLDSDILSEILKGINPTVEKRKNAYEAHFHQLTFTAPSVMEILTGYRKRGAPAQQQRAATLFSLKNEIIPDAADFRLATEINGDLLKDGRVIGMVDPLIAACAIRRGLGVASGNTAHFEFIHNVGYSFHLENWRNP